MYPVFCLKIEKDGNNFPSQQFYEKTKLVRQNAIFNYFLHIPDLLKRYFKVIMVSE